ncbi:nuclear exosome regulator NRDE2 [Tenrec ecaudatus]|uniref:nuclear exosome regulator NRDE2 n=1 Tax=Tenrec ecaudatus TaxID=94439 RepID=UPI003F5A1AE9
MALFPAFADVDEVADSRNPRKGADLDWLHNPSFCVGAVVAPCQQPQEVPRLTSEQSPPTRSPLKSEPSDESAVGPQLKPASRKKKKEKKRKRRHEHKRTERRRGRSSSSSGSGSGSEVDADADRGRSSRSVSKKDSGKPGQESPTDTSCQFVWLEDVQALSGETFRMDKKPDPANWEYKCPYRGHIARYKRKGNSCLGLDPRRQCVSWEGAPAGQKRAHRRVERYFTKRSAGLLSLDSEAVSAQSEPPTTEPLGFIPVKDAGEAAPPVATWLNPLGVYDPSTTQWLQGQGPMEQELKPPGAQADPASALLKAKVEELNRKVRENPRDIQLWLAFVAFQDEVAQSPGPYATEAGGQEKRKRSLKLLLEKKLAILERAIGSNPSSVALKLARLQLCAEFWEPATLLKEWQTLVFLHPNDAALWQRYLLFCQSQFSTFSVSKVHSLYGKCLSTLSSVNDGSILSHPALPGTEEALFGLFLQQCHFLRQAGHAEKAVSLFQAMVDFTFFKPDSVKDLPTRGQVEFFEPFWDSGEPRPGEKGARGWRAWMHQQERGGWVVVSPDEEDEEPDEDEQEIGDRTLPRAQIWLRAERSRDRRHWRPWRPDRTKKQTEEDCEDPERQVLFDDIGQCLIRLASPELQFQLVAAFLQFLGVPCDFAPPASCLYMAMDESSIFTGGLGGEKPLSGASPAFSGVSGVGRMDQFGAPCAAPGHDREGEEFIRNIFHLALPLFSGKDKARLCAAWLQHETAKVVWCLHTKAKKKLRSQGKNCRKLAKNLLREPESNSSVGLWRHYAHLEWLLGNTEDARKVLDTALGMAGAGGLRDAQLCELGLLYAQLEVELLPAAQEATASRAVHVLTGLAQSAPYGPYPGHVLPVHILKARKAYEHALQDALQESCGSEPAPAGRLGSLAKCFMLFQYLTVGIEAAGRIHEQVRAKLKGSAVSEGSGPGPAGQPQSWAGELEAITLLHTSLLQFHLSVSVHPLAPLREALTEALRLYPGNQALWRAYVQTQSKSHSASKTRRFFDTVTRSAASLEPWLFAIETEKARKRRVETVQRVDGGEIHTTIPEIGLTNRIQALFEHAIQTDRGRQCPLLWRMYLHFLVSLGNRERSKGVFYKALQNCPWAKVLYMDALEYFPDEMQEILDLMTEKELRVRLPLEELELLLED